MPSRYDRNEPICWTAKVTGTCDDQVELTDLAAELAPRVYHPLSRKRPRRKPLPRLMIQRFSLAPGAKLWLK